MLLPWYATGKLDRADGARVESLSGAASAGCAPARPDPGRAGAGCARQRGAGLAVGGRTRSAHGLAARPQARLLARSASPAAACSALERFLRRAHGARRAMGRGRGGGAHRRAGRGHHDARRAQRRRHLSDRASGAAMDRRRRLAARRLCGRCQGLGHRPAACGIRCQHRGRAQARRRIQDQAADGGPVAELRRTRWCGGWPNGATSCATVLPSRD